jgi:hypothetical protein
MAQTSCRSDPQAPIASAQKVVNRPTRRVLPIRPLPLSEPDTVKPVQAGLASDPDISVRGLRDVVCRTDEAVLYSPGGMTELRDQGMGIQGSHPGRRQEVENREQAERSLDIRSRSCPFSLKHYKLRDRRLARLDARHPAWDYAERAHQNRLTEGMEPHHRSKPPEY